MFFHLESPKTLLGSPLPLGELLHLLPQVLIRLGGLGELRVDVLVLAGEGLDVLEHLLDLHGLRLDQLRRVLTVLSQGA